LDMLSIQWTWDESCVRDETILEEL
jgi:hypothetical protein